MSQRGRVGVLGHLRTLELTARLVEKVVEKTSGLLLRVLPFGWDRTVVKCKGKGGRGGMYARGRWSGIGEGWHALWKDGRLYIGGIGWVGMVRPVLHMVGVFLILAKESKRI